MMTRKHYEVIAQLISTARDHHPSIEAGEALDSLTYMLCGAFGTDNSQFKPEKFQIAAGAR